MTKELTPRALEHLNVVVVGHVDHGKSTVVGRLLADTDALPEGKLEQIRQRCLDTGKTFEYAFLLDALHDEQEQGITIDAARIFFRSKKREYIILDAPGHIEFLRNMVTGAARAEAALLVIDIAEGVQENSRRHGALLSLLGVRHVVVLVNKMDLVKYQQSAFERICAEYGEFLRSVGVQAHSYIPVSGYHGDNLVSASAKTPWYHGKSLLETLDELPKAIGADSLPLRMPVQAVYKFTRFGDSRRIVVGTIQSGRLAVNDEVIFFPSGKHSRVKAFETFPTSTKHEASAGEAVSFTLSEQIYVTRGEIVAKASDPGPKVGTRFRASIFWLGLDALRKNFEYSLKLGTIKVPVRVVEIEKVIDAGDFSNLSDLDRIERNRVGECLLETQKAIAFEEVAEHEALGRFVLVDGYRICGGGIIRQAISDPRSTIRERKLRREAKWIAGAIALEDRAERYGQRPCLVLISGLAPAPRKELGRFLEARLFQMGRATYFLGMGNIVYGLDSDLDPQGLPGQEHLRRLAEVANIMLDAGMIFVVSAADLSRADIDLVTEVIGAENVLPVWYGDGDEPDVNNLLVIGDTDDQRSGADRIVEELFERRVIFRPL